MTDGYHATGYDVEGTGVVIPEGLHVETAAEYADDSAQGDSVAVLPATGVANVRKAFSSVDPVSDRTESTEQATDADVLTVPDGVDAQTHADRLADFLMPTTHSGSIPVPHVETFRDRIYSAAGRIALSKLTRKDLSHRCPICRNGDLDECPEPTRPGTISRQRRRATARESAKAPVEGDVWYRCESCRGTVRIQRRR